MFFGYSFENTSSTAIGDVTRANLQGWEGSLEGKLVPWVGLVTDFSGHYGTQNFTEPTPGGPTNISLTGHEYDVLFGPRVSIPVGKFTPFGEFMVGVAHISTTGNAPTGTFFSNTSVATAVGGGIDYRLVRLVALRVEGDYIATRFYSTTQNDLRVSTGIVFRF